MDTTADVSPVASMPKFQAILDYGHGLYATHEIHTHRLAEVVANTEQATLYLADGFCCAIESGTITHTEPYPAHTDNRFVWTPV